MQLSSIANTLGPEVTAEAVRVLETISKFTPLRLEITSKDFGGAAIDAAGDPLPEDTLKSCKEADAILLGEFILDPWTEGRMEWYHHHEQRRTSRVKANIQVPSVDPNGESDLFVLNKVSYAFVKNLACTPTFVRPISLASRCSTIARSSRKLRRVLT